MAAREPKRDPTKEQFWRETVKAQKQSRQSIREFCREHEIAESAFYFWRRELRQRDAAMPVSQSNRCLETTKKTFPSRDSDHREMFVSVSLVESKGKCSAPTTGAVMSKTMFEMVLPSGSVLRWFGGDAELATEWIAKLEARLC